MRPTHPSRVLVLLMVLLVGALSVHTDVLASSLETHSLGDFGFLVPDETDWMFNPALLGDEHQPWALVESESAYDPSSERTYDSSGNLTSGLGSDTWSITVAPSGVLPLASGTLGFSAHAAPTSALSLSTDTTTSSMDLGIRAGYGTRLSPRLAIGASLQYATLQRGERPSTGDSVPTYLSRSVRPWIGLVYHPDAWAPVEIALNPVYYWGESYSTTTGDVTSTYSEPYVRVRLRTQHPGAQGSKLWLTGEHVQWSYTRRDASGTATSETGYRRDAAGLTSEWVRAGGRLLAGAEVYNWAQSTESPTVSSVGETGIALRAGASADLTPALQLRAGVRADLVYRSESSRPSPGSDPTSTSATLEVDADPYLGLGLEVADWTVDLEFPVGRSDVWTTTTENPLAGTKTVERSGVSALIVAARRSF
ncbi:hypothetical protein [Limnochorda pilosa]|uniref:Uncharacterized protein n=1 Tax=Limnochorda pilosa TaxID=1555112 RepID=A0A0K2SQ82_LIMPI|nr:hypothetical protein [Limnochorda pilosa]BAS29285.1 hypothetical protein LIP_3473 [Limnochorda pilosa]